MKSADELGRTTIVSAVIRLKFAAYGANIENQEVFSEAACEIDERN